MAEPDVQPLHEARRDLWITAAVAAAGAVGVLLAHPAPTGSTGTDAALVLVGVALVVWTAAWAPWWLGVGAAVVGAGVGVASGHGALAVAFGAVAAIGGSVAGLSGRTTTWSRAIVAALALQSLVHLGEVGHLGISAAIGVVVAAVLGITGLVHRPHLERTIVSGLLGILTFVVVASAIGLGIAAASARDDLERGDRTARQAIGQLGSGDIAGARATFAIAADALESADANLERSLSSPAKLVPVLAQNRRAAVALVHDAATSLRAITDVLAKIDLDALRLTKARIDTDAIARLQQPIEQLDATLGRLDSTIAAVGTDRWVISALRDRLSGLRADIARQRGRTGNLLQIVRRAPAMLGADGPRVWFVGFLTPAEARGGGGFLANWAELTIDHGQISMSAFGRHGDLDTALAASTRRVTGPASWLTNWGPYVTVDTSGTASATTWSNVNVSPRFTDTAQVIAQLYPQSGGRQVDGVITMDVAALARLLELTGPIDVGTDQALTADDAAEFLLRGQYLVADDTAEHEVLDQAAHQTVATLFGGTLPAPPRLADLFAPLIAGGHLQAWTAHADDEQVFADAKMAGDLPAPGDGDAYTFAVTNRAGNKVDAYVDGHSTYTVTTDAASGTVHATATLVLHDGVPTTGLPNEVVGNQLGLPSGTAQELVTIYSVLQPTAITVDGQPVALTATSEAGYHATTTTITIAPGDSVTVSVELTGSLDLAAGYHVVVRTPPLAVGIPIDVSVDDNDVGPSEGPGVVTRRFPAD
jgi:hypothetical protein